MEKEFAYRKGVLGVIFDEENRFLLVNLQDYKEDEWNFPGGGTETDETIIQNLYRELKEELNIDKDDIEIIGQSKNPVQYDFPLEIIENHIKKGKMTGYKGQIKEQILTKFIGNKEKIKIQEKEIRKYEWVEYKNIKDYLKFPNQYDRLNKLLEEFNISM